MILQLVKSRRKQILVDIDTQKDFLLAQGKACIRNHRRVLAHIRRVMAWARTQNIPIISTAEVYPDNNGESSVNYCVDGTDGQKKIRYTLFNDRVTFVADGNTDLPRDMLRRYKQIILHKRCVDPFDEPRIDRLLSEVRANEFYLVGTTLEGAVKMTALGLLQRGKPVTVIVDAVGSRSKKEAMLTLRKMETKGAKLIDTKKLAGTSHLRLVGTCGCESCQGAGRKASANTTEED
ncbi:MAG: isochorismatase family protein [Phycisphaerales bacterium]|nr:MAG: isochorismatase family protein [Phycisphaerales bacterium]UCF14915.1 MAG: isochorismatase family protein [Phycisphaerales bacterium]